MERSSLKTLLVVLVLLAEIACTNPKPEKRESAVTEVSVPKKPPSSYQDTFFLESKAAVFYYPDSAQLMKIRSVVDSGALSSVLHEFEYLEKNARNVMREYYPEIPILLARNKRYLLFRSPNRDSCVDLDKVGDPIGLYLFMPGKDPRPADLPNVSTDLAVYFSGN